MPAIVPATSPNRQHKLTHAIAGLFLLEMQDAGVQVSNEDTADLQWEVGLNCSLSTSSDRAPARSRGLLQAQLGPREPKVHSSSTSRQLAEVVSGDGSLVALEEELQASRDPRSSTWHPSSNLQKIFCIRDSVLRGCGLRRRRRSAVRPNRPVNPRELTR